MAYTQLGPFVDGAAPYLSATNLNHLEAGVLTGANGDGWTGYTPTTTGVTIGTGGGLTWVWRYEQSQVHVKGFIGIGTSGGAVTGSVTFTLPTAASTAYLPTLGVAYLVGGAPAPGQVVLTDATHAVIYAWTVSSSYILNVALGPTIPFAWGSGNYLEVDFIYTAA